MTGIGSLSEKLSQCSRVRRGWAGNRFNHLEKKIKNMRLERDRLLSSTNTQDNSSQIKLLEFQIEKLSDQEKIHWKQRARVNWLNHRDQNTKFFHAAASTRRHSNFIKVFCNSSGAWVSEEQGMSELTMDYFAHLFTSSNPLGFDIDEAIRSTDLVVDSHVDDLLCAPFNAREVHKAIFDMHPSKAPGPDGFTAFFYQKLWPEIGGDITAVALSILHHHGEIQSGTLLLLH